MTHWLMLRLSHVTLMFDAQMNELCHIHEWVSHTYAWVMSHSYVWHDSHSCLTRLIHMCELTNSNVRHDSFIRVTWLIHECDMTRSYVWHVMSHIEPVMSYIHMGHVTHMNESCHTYEWVMSHIWMSHVTIWMRHVTQISEPRHTYEWIMSHNRVISITECVMSYIHMGHVTRKNESCHTN